MGYLVSILILIIIILAARLFILRREISRISKDLQDFHTSGTGRKLIVSMLHKPLETLCQHINFGIEVQDKARIEAENHEARLRTQISNISHDLRTPLTAILGYLAMSKAAPEKTAAYLEIMESRATALQALVEQFYELSILEDSRTELVLEPVDIIAAVTECLLGNYALFEKKGIEPESQLPEQVIMVTSNARVLERIFQNLLQNALKFAKHSITISLREEGAHCIFTISNDARNLSEGDIDHLFERFYTAEQSRTAGNTGLGLYIVKQLLEKTKGSVGSVNLKNEWFTLEIFFTKI